MSKEPVRRQWADDDEDDDREVNSTLMPISNLEFQAIYTYPVSNKILVHQIQSQRGSNGTVKDRITFSVNAKNQKVAHIFVNIELQLSSLKNFSTVVIIT